MLFCKIILKKRDVEENRQNQNISHFHSLLLLFGLFVVGFLLLGRGGGA